jgi:hypothetical protein
VTLLLSGQNGGLLAADWLIAGHALWVVLALANYGGIGQGLESGGIYIVESLGSYLLGRCYIRSGASFEALIKFMVALIIIMMIFTVPEALTGNHVAREVFRAVLGGPPIPHIDPRLGLHRAFGPFDHPILYGTFCASVFSAAYYVLAKERFGAVMITWCFVVGLATFASVSAGALVAAAIQGGLMTWDRLTRGIKGRWMILGSLMVLGWTLLALVSNRSPIKVLIGIFSFSSVSSYNRILIWEFGTAEIARHPIFGIGFGDWQRPDWMQWAQSDSMDNFWLATAVRFGLPALIFLLGAIFWIVFRIGRKRLVDNLTRRCRKAFFFSLAGLVVAGCTVHFWNALFCLFFFLLGAGVWTLSMTAERSQTRTKI